MPVKYDQDTRAKAIRLVRDGSLKMWEHLRRQGITAARCTVERLTAFVQKAIRQAAALRARQGHPIGGQAIAHSDAGSQYTSVWYAETLMLAGLTGSVGSVGDAYDNALAETTIGLYKTECTRDGSPFRTDPIAALADLEECTSAWVHWYNNHRLMHRLGRRPPAEAEAAYYQAAAPGRAA